MRNLIKLIILFLFISVAFSNLDNANKPIRKKDTKFLDGMNSKNPEAQSKINQLKKDFYNERENIHQAYEEKIKSLKESRRKEVAKLKKKYRKKLRKLRKKYPDIPDMVLD